MKDCKKSFLWSNEMSKFQRREQVILSRLRTGCTRATHRHIIEREIIPICPHSETRLTLDHFLWECQGTKAVRDRIAINKDIWKTGLAGLAKLIDTKKIEIFHEEQQGFKETHTRQGTGNQRMGIQIGEVLLFNYFLFFRNL
jgi:hypothetical protein